MRLTLRTLLAYVDNTLEPQDAEDLRQKLTESGFATQLVKRMREMLTSGSLSAPSPGSVGPVEDANVISEYLDSTLPAEQVAEIERACLESDPHLAEASACHQILTIVLGKPAEVSPELRERVYALPDRKLEDIASGRSFSAVSIPAPQGVDSLAGIPTTDVTSAPQEPVTPVGVNDSGVSDAPTRLRQAETAGRGAASSPGPAIAGSRPRSVNEATLYGGSIRPSRIAPWLVSFALVAALIFLLAQTFKSLWEPKQVADQAPAGLPSDLMSVPPVTDESTSQGEAEAADEQAAAVTETETDAEEGVEATDEVESAAPPPPPGATDDVATDDAPPQPEVSEQPAATDDTDAVTPDAATGQPSAVAAVETEEMTDAGSETPSAEADVVEDAAPPPPTVSADAPPAPAADDVEAVAPPVPPATADTSEDPEPEAAEIATVTSDATLLAALVGEQWVRLDKDAKVAAGSRLVCAPTFRAQVTVPGATVTLIGPTEVEWIADDDGSPVMVLDIGRALIASTEADASLRVRLGDQDMSLRFAEAEAVAAASVQYFRAAGFDPLVPENRRTLTGLYAAQGNLEVTVDGSPNQLPAGQQWVKRGSADAQVSAAETAPAWIDEADPSEAALEIGAREGLLELIQGEQSLEISLREASQFRRSEVAALAGQSLLNLGFGDVYFGGDGILSEPKQRAYWPDHFAALLATTDRSAERAAELRASIVKMDSANALPLFRLLTGYSQNQLVEGGDEELVEMLDSPSMAVRVCALENLRRITGTTLYFRPEQDNDVRRAPVIKKWVARLRKGDIRWQE